MVDFFCTVFIVELDHAYKAIRRPQQNDCKRDSSIFLW